MTLPNKARGNSCEEYPVRQNTLELSGQVRKARRKVIQSKGLCYCSTVDPRRERQVLAALVIASKQILFCFVLFY